MKLLVKIIYLLILFCNTTYSQVGIGTVTPHKSSILDIESQDQGFLPPRLMEQQKNDIDEPATGLVVYCLDGENSGLQIFDGTEWQVLVVEKSLSKAALNSENVNVRIVNTMYDLAEISVNCQEDFFEMVVLLGFHTPNDGGGGIFYFDCSQSQQDHNGGTIIAVDKVFPSTWDGSQLWFDPPQSSNTGCWLRHIEEKPVNALWFGAKDEKDTPISNAVDSTIPINEAINYAHSSSIHYLYIPSGKFIINGTINAIDHQVSDKRIKITGDYMGHLPNVGTVLFRKENTNNQNPMLSIDTTNGGLINYGSVPFLEISNLSFIGDTTTEHEGIYIRTVGLNNPLFKNLHFAYLKGTPLHIVQSEPNARCEFMLVERMIVGMDWGSYDKPIQDIRPNSDNSNGIYLEGNNTAFDGIKINKCQFHGKEDSSSPAILADVIGDILTIEDSQFHGSSNAVVTSIRELKMTGSYIEKTNNSSVKLLNNKNSIFRGNKIFNINHSLFSQLSNILEIIDYEDIGSSTKGYIGQFYVLREPSLNGTSIIKGLGNNSKIKVGVYSSNFLSDNGYTSQSLRIFGNTVSNLQKKNISGFKSHLQTYEVTDGINFSTDLGENSFYTIDINTLLGLDNGLAITRRLSSSAIYTPLNIGAGGGFKLRTYKTSSGQQPAIFADYTGNIHIGKETSATEKLEVFGNVKANAFIAPNATYSDYVFEKYFTGESEINKDYNLRSIEEVEEYIKNHFHMEGYESIRDIKKDSEGNFLVDINKQSFLNKEKIEELLLYLINQNKEIKALREENRNLLLRVKNIEERIKN